VNICKIAVVAMFLSILIFGCDSGNDSEDTRPVPPQYPMGIAGHFGSDSPLILYVGWVDSARNSVDGYNVYKKVGTSDAQKLNSLLVVESMFGPEGGGFLVLGFEDTLFDSTSSDTHTYWGTAVKGDEESLPSEHIVFVPADLDTSDHVTGLAPNGIEDVPLDTSFSWNAKTGAESYWIVVQEDKGPSPMTWIYRHTTTEVAYKETAGITYGDNGEDSLPSYSSVCWGVGAINENNFMFAINTDASFWTEGVYEPLIDCDDLVYGEWAACWDQTDNYGVQVPVGTYRARMRAGNFDSTLTFRIAEGGVSNPTPPNCNPPCDTTAGAIIPTSFSFSTTGSVYEPGATIVLDFDLPRSSPVHISVSPDN